MEKYILIDSKYRTNKEDSTSNFRVYLPNTIIIKNKLSIKYLFIPRLNYLINSNNNSFNISFITSSGISAYNVILPYQQFTPLELVTYINMNLNFFGFNMTYNVNTYKFQFSATCDFNLDFSISDFNKLMSLDKIIYNSVNNKFITNIINFNYPQYLNLQISNITNDVMISTNPNIIINFIIPIISCNFGDIISHKLVDYDISMSLDNYKLKYLDIRILDDQNILFDNNNANWFMILSYV